jgi:hypothetical protein
MKKKKNLAFALTFLGVLLLLIALTFYLDRLTPGIAMAEGAIIMDWITAAVGLILLIGGVVVYSRKN